MGKKYHGKQCAYCVIKKSNTDEHIFSRSFFMPERRANLPKAPACSICNTEKSRLEHYLASVLTFGGRHTDAAANLTVMVPPRLAKNARLQRELAAHMSEHWEQTGSGLFLKAGAIPFDSSKLTQYMEFVARGLLWYHWGLYLDSESFVQAMCLTKAGEKLIRSQIALKAKERVSNSLGNGTIDYDGAQGTDRANVSVRHFRLYGGVILGDSSASDEVSTSIGVFTGPKRAWLNPRLRANTKDLRLEALLPLSMYPGTKIPRLTAIENRSTLTAIPATAPPPPPYPPPARNS